MPFTPVVDLWASRICNRPSAVEECRLGGWGQLRKGHQGEINPAFSSVMDDYRAHLGAQRCYVVDANGQASQLAVFECDVLEKGHLAWIQELQHVAGSAVLADVYHSVFPVYPEDPGV